MTAAANTTLTAVHGVQVGHATVPGGGSGCTVVVGPFRAVAQVTGMASGSRELHVLGLEHLVPTVDAILLTGGSAFGLAAADGVMTWMAERGRGFDVGGQRVPLVPAAVIFDLAPGRERPGPATGRAACDAASEGPVPLGRVGAGAGARVGKLAGPAGSMPGGIGSWAVTCGEWTLGALAVVNALGDVLDGRGQIVAGARGSDGAFLDSARMLREGAPELLARGAPKPGRNTTLAVVATDAPLGKVDLLRLGRIAATALPRRISPVHTPFDGDVVFSASAGGAERALTDLQVLALGVAARDALEEAITNAVR